MSKEEDDFWKNRETYLKIRGQYSDLTMGKIRQQIALQEFREFERLTGTGQQEEFECDVCRRKGKGYIFEEYHFENCKLNGLDLNYIFTVIRTTPREYTLRRFQEEGIDFDLGDIKMIISNFPEEIPEKRKYICPHCHSSGSVTFVTKHFDNCPFKGVNIQELISFFKKIDSPKFSYIRTAEKYNIQVSEVKKFIKDQKVPIPKTKHRVISNFKHGEKYTCSICGQKGEGPLFGTLHFDNCWITKLPKKQLEQFKLDVGLFSVKEICRKYNLSNANVLNYYKTHNIEWDIYQTRRCPYCNTTGSGGVWYSKHFGNCDIKTKKIELKDLVRDLKTNSIRICHEKYGIPKRLLEGVRREN
jgi:hypothetical protein